MSNKLASNLKRQNKLVNLGFHCAEKKENKMYRRFTGLRLKRLTNFEKRNVHFI